MNLAASTIVPSTSSAIKIDRNRVLDGCREIPFAEAMVASSFTSDRAQTGADRSLLGPGPACIPDDFDTDPWLLNVANGTIDLSTGKLRQHHPKDLITKLAPVVYDAAAKCSNWLEFLNMIMGGREQLITFLKKAFGVSLSGITSEKAMYILYGAGGDNREVHHDRRHETDHGGLRRRTPVETFLRKREGAFPMMWRGLKGHHLCGRRTGIACPSLLLKR